MTLNREKARKLLKDFDFPALFIEHLGWDRYAASLDFTIDGKRYALRGLAEKRGVQVFECRAETADQMPDFTAQRKIETQLRRAAREHIVIYTDATRGKQVWKPVDWRGHEFYPGHQTGDALIDKLQGIQIPLDEEESLDLLGTVHKIRDAFDREKLTKRFYDLFQKEHKTFLGFIDGILEIGDREWYASIMLNRLMFVYFIQRKGFLDGDQHYLRNRLKAVQSRQGKGNFHSFYRYFLLALFHQAFAVQPGQRRLDADLAALLGDVPYLNGGLFEVHELERDNPKIEVPDEAFERIFRFFDGYEWTLDTRPLRAGNEINPDVLGYIFEKYINQKQMGAYYTKEDITDYIGRNTIVPFIFDEARKKCAVAFQPGSALWRLLAESPDRYIYPAVLKGVIDDQGEVIPLPVEIERGVRDVAARGGWNRPAAAPYALPTETWREHVARRQRCIELRQRLAAGEICQINDLITWNLDIQRFAEDAILSSEGPELLRAFYQAITGVTVLDPTCGSGAFLFAALKILGPLYEACLDRMTTFVQNLDRGDLSPLSPISGGDSRSKAAASRRTPKPSPATFNDFRAVLAEVARHPSPGYFVLKSIIVKNLYGVDIMDEAVEICKLRLFLKLVCQIDNVAQLEPLPDIDFNIRAGNTLVGYTTIEEIRASQAGKLAFASSEIARIEAQAQALANNFDAFRRRQTEREEGEFSSEELAAAKQTLRKIQAGLADDLDRYLAGDYGIDAGERKHAKAYEAWRASHQPFHWIAEFFGIMTRGGFDVIIGNPPYVEYSTIEPTYSIHGYCTESCGNLYAFTWERCVDISRQQSRLGMIVPVASVCTDGYAPLQQLLWNSGTSVISAFNDRPSKLFDGLEHIRLCIIVHERGARPARTYCTTYNKWQAVERESLFRRLSFIETTDVNRGGSAAKIGSLLETELLLKVNRESRALRDNLSFEGSSHIYYTRKLSHFVQILAFVPRITDARGTVREPSELKELTFSDNEERDCYLAILNSSLFFWLLTVYSDCRNLNKREIESTPLDVKLMLPEHRKELVKLCRDLMSDVKKNSRTLTMNYKKHGQLKIQCTYPRHSKMIIDDIDRCLGRHFGFGSEEIDFLVNFDIKYRLGQADEKEE